MSDWFAHCRTLDEARAEYRRLCFVHHPDHGGDTLVMQAINAAYTQFRRTFYAPRRAANGSRHHWQKPARQRPTDVPFETGRNSHAAPEPQPSHSHDYFWAQWHAAPWQRLANGGFLRRLWGHRVTIFQPADPKFRGAWFVILDDAFSPYFYNDRAEAERAAFELLYEKVKYLDV